MVRPRNVDSAVEEILALLILDPRQPFNLELNDPEGELNLQPQNNNSNNIVNNTEGVKFV